MRGNEEEETNLGVEPIDSAPFLNVKGKEDEAIQDAILLVRLSNGNVAIGSSVEYGGKAYDFDCGKSSEWDRILRIASDLKNQVTTDIISKTTASLILGSLMQKEENGEEDNGEDEK